MEETDLSQLNETEIMSMFPDIIESGSQLIAVKSAGCAPNLPFDCGNYCCATSCNTATSVCRIK